MLRKLIGAALSVVLAPIAFGATFNVTTPAEFQAALTTAQSNGESDTINVAAGNYNIAASGTLTYTATATEFGSLSIFGEDSTFVILDGGAQVPILRIDTTAVSSGSVFVQVWDMTFQNGNATGTYTDGGALAILTDDTAGLGAGFLATVIQITGSEFYGNSADDRGGAIYIRGHAVEGILLMNLTVDGNQAGVDGGGAYIAGNVFTTPIDLTNIDFWNNSAQGSGGGVMVEGFDMATPSEDRARSVVLGDILFYNNQSLGASGGGGGADLSADRVNIGTVGFVDNTATTGAGLRVRDQFSQFGMDNSGFIGNAASGDGGGLAAGPTIFGSVTLTNNTVYQNTATNNGGGMYVEVDGSSTIAAFYNNIIYANAVQTGLGDDLYVNNNAYNDIAAVVQIYNNIISGFQVVPGPAASGLNINQAPVFVNPDLRPEPDPRLVLDSPGIDAGDNNAPGVPNVDFELDTRPLDGNGDALAVVDIGMDEFSGAPAQNADLSVLNFDSPDPVTEGGDITYTITVTNDGPGGATAVTLVDVLDTAVTFTSATVSQGTCAENAGTVTCVIGTLANGASATATIVVGTPDVIEPVVVNNQASVSAAENDPNSANDAAAQQTTIVPVGPAMADLALTKGDSPDPVYSGGPVLTYTVVVTNNGPDAASGVALTDTLPAGVTFESVTGGSATCSELDGGVTCDIGGLAVNGSATVTIVVTPDTVTAPADITNSAAVTATEEDPTPGNNTATETTRVNPPSSDLGLSVASTPAQPLINEQITFDATVTNAGPSDNTGAVLTVTLPPMATFVSVTIDQGTCDVAAGTVTCTIGDLAALSSVAAQILVTGPAEAVTLTLSATVTADVADPTPGDNAVSRSVTVIDVIDIVIEGVSEGSGSFGWADLLLLLVAAGLIAARSRRVPLFARATVTGPLIAVLAGGLLVATSGKAFAEDGWYLGASVGRSNLDYSESDLVNDLANLGWTINNPSIDETHTAWKVYGGFRFNDWFGLEAGYADLGKVTTRFGATIPPTDIDALLNDTFSIHPYQGDGWLAAGVLRWPFVPDRFALAVRAGIFAWKSDIDVHVVSGGTGRVSGDDSGTDAMYGLGFEWQINPRWTLTADWERYQMNQWLDVPSIGVRFGF